MCHSYVGICLFCAIKKPFPKRYYFLSFAAFIHPFDSAQWDFSRKPGLWDDLFHGNVTGGRCWRSPRERAVFLLIFRLMGDQFGCRSMHLEDRIKKPFYLAIFFVDVIYLRILTKNRILYLDMLR